MRRIGLALLCLLLAGVPLSAQEMPDVEPIREFISAQPEDVAVLCQSSDAFEHNAGQRFPLASVFKLFVLAEAARQLDEGAFDPDEVVPLADVNAYWLPGTDGGAHDLFLEYLGSDREELTLSEVAYGMIRFSSNAAVDYLMHRLGDAGYPALFELLDIQDSDMPSYSRTILGLGLMADNHEMGRIDLEAMDAETFAAERIRLTDLFVNDTQWREAELAYQDGQTARAQALAAEDEETIIQFYWDDYELYARYGYWGTPRDVLKVLQAAHSGDVFSAEAQDFVQQSLGWLLVENPANQEVYTALSSKGGSWSGILTDTWYVQPVEADLTRIAVFYRNLSPERWEQLYTDGLFQALQVRVFAYGEGCSSFEQVFEDVPAA